MARFALLDAEGVVRNIVVAEGAWQPPEGLTKRAAGAEAQIGGRWTGTAWEPATPAPPALPTRTELLALLQQVQAQIESLPPEEP
ncbi:hypothetical protein KTR66_04720 [Roseococcus sp. SDR]|uniref:hypothetical protein n=1 Tax=Roseococcus sp. SDR TaxID=2835532 RepID=UPI001BCB1A21|nr:hypothetical protein [Roseococcus sp. SDR]MBS7789283.1 hypothetical protein [Roseococcus sp. SDR]MBV1844597.1 hypothetical protein [Roseococcus sp. SDR]